jgi:plasmid replication initiation protein
MPHGTAQQAPALLEMTTAVQGPPSTEWCLLTTDFGARSTPSDESAIRSKLDTLEAAELALVHARAGAFAKLQATLDRLDSEQMAWLISAVVRTALKRASWKAGAAGHDYQCPITWTSARLR